MEDEIDRLEWLVARALEPKPGRPADDDIAALFWDESTRTSPAGLYRVVMHYDEGDQPRWQPLAFGRSGDAMLALVRALTAAGWTVDAHTGTDVVRAVVRDQDGVEAERSELVGPDRGLPEAVLRAACAALRPVG